LTQRHKNSFIRAIRCTQFKSGSAYIDKAVKSVITQHKRAKKSCGLAKNESGTAYIDKAVKSVITQHKNSSLNTSNSSLNTKIGGNNENESQQHTQPEWHLTTGAT